MCDLSAKKVMRVLQEASQPRQARPKDGVSAFTRRWCTVDARGVGTWGYFQG